MKGKALLESLVVAAKSKGVTVRREALKGALSQGGLCLLKGVPTVFIDDRALVDSQIDVLARVLRRFVWTDDDRAALDPAVASALRSDGGPRAR